MKNQTTYMFILTIFLFTSCDNKSKKETKDNSSATVSPNEPAIPVSSRTLDTTITLSKISLSKYTGSNLTDSSAKTILYNHFKSIGLLISDNLPTNISENDRKKTCVLYDTIFIADINKNKYSDAIITYWLTPFGSSGHCFQPHKATIVDTDNGYNITNEEFIPTNFVIDSVVSTDKHVNIFSYDYDCSNNKVLRQLKLTLK